MSMSLKTDLFDSLFPQLKGPTFQTFTFDDVMEAVSLSKPKDDGKTTIDISIYLSKGNTQTSISDLFSAILTPSSEKELQQLIETFVKGVGEVFGKDYSGNTQQS